MYARLLYVSPSGNVDVCKTVTEYPMQWTLHTGIKARPRWLMSTISCLMTSTEARPAPGERPPSCNQHHTPQRGVHTYLRVSNRVPSGVMALAPPHGKRTVSAVLARVSSVTLPLVHALYMPARFCGWLEDKKLRTCCSGEGGEGGRGTVTGVQYRVSSICHVGGRNCKHGALVKFCP